MDRGYDYFFDVAASVKNERFTNDWEETGKEAYFSAKKVGLDDPDELVNAIRKKASSLLSI